MNIDLQRWRLQQRILLGVVCVLTVAGTTAWVVALSTGPLVFHRHMLMVETPHPDPEVVGHAEEAFSHAWQISLALALLAACLTAAIVSAVLARRITATVETVRAAAQEVAAGDYAARVPEGSVGIELAELVQAFNGMAHKLAATEQTRKRLLSDLAHEMRTPLSTLSGYLEGLQDGVSKPDPQTLAMLREQTERLRRLAEDISLVSATEEDQLRMHKELITVSALLTAAQAQVEASYRAAGVRLSVDDSSGAACVIGDRDRLSQVLTNLLDNALRHTTAGDLVTVRSRRTAETVLLQVEDSGRGICAEHLPHLFERFYRADTARDRAHGGSGIGLAIVRSITEAHQGRVAAFSDGLGHGALFSVELPISDVATE